MKNYPEKELERITLTLSTDNERTKLGLIRIATPSQRMEIKKDNCRTPEAREKKKKSLAR